MILYPKISNLIIGRYQNECIKKYEEDILNIQKDIKNKEYERARLYNEILNGNIVGIDCEDYNDILNLSKNGIMSYIEIPKISVYLPIYHGTKNEEMKKGVGHIEKTSLPIGGKSTHCVLTGHTGLIRTKIFTRLNELNLKDEVYIYTLDIKLKYKVYEIKIVLPTEVKDLQIQENKDLLTLVTCTPYGINTHRLLVKCERVN